jgi:predicted DNA-binding protein (MmcQ/YjbR family)
VAKKDNDKTLQRVTDLGLALPSAECSRSGDHATYRVRGKVFAYFLDDHHGDGIVSICVKGELGENTDRARREPERFYLPAYIGPRGWFGLRLDRGRVSWKEVAELLERSYRLTAPKTLVKKLDAA